MNWGSAADFFAMGGDGFFVWGSYAVCLACMLVEPGLTAHRRRRALNDARGDGASPGAAGPQDDDEEDSRT